MFIGHPSLLHASNFNKLMRRPSVIRGVRKKSCRSRCEIREASPKRTTVGAVWSLYRPGCLRAVRAAGELPARRVSRRRGDSQHLG